MYLFQLTEQERKAITEALFTFHYVSISTFPTGADNLLVVNLHSTMYLFQLYVVFISFYCWNYLHSTMYLFQHITLSNQYLKRISFTFHYVSISTESNPAYQYVSFIYIPLCIYFNLSRKNNKEHEEVNLHSTMYLFQQDKTEDKTEDKTNLHSTMYLFQLFLLLITELLF